MTARDPAALWFHSPRPRPDARLRLFCCAHAGAAAHVFHAWPAGLPPDVEVCAVQLPGRAFRLAEPAYTAVEPLVAALDAAAAPLLDRPFAVFGHSMGALVAFEWTRALRRRRGPCPSACACPPSAARTSPTPPARCTASPTTSSSPPCSSATASSTTPSPTPSCGL
ncbi:thioesterase II family protein [Nannocystis pusilla]|uniref:thioesterase II family protein n=1 Tax=Nannocystis pusilla TaxID=889268 RepID=UPI003B7700C9